MTDNKKGRNGGDRANQKTSAEILDDFAPEYPAHDTQAARLLAAALLGQRVNPLTGWKRLGIYRLADTKFRVKEMGWPMESGRLDVPNRFGEACHVALYGLPDWAIEAAGERGRQFAEREMELMATRRAA